MYAFHFALETLLGSKFSFWSILQGCEILNENLLVLSCQRHAMCALNLALGLLLGSLRPPILLARAVNIQVKTQRIRSTIPIPPPSLIRFIPTALAEFDDKSRFIGTYIPAADR